jgi:hypothetical protein
MTDQKTGDTPTSSTPHAREKALAVLYKKKIAIWWMKDVRNCVLSGDIERGISLMMTQYEFERDEAETVMAYFNPAMKGCRIRLEEISPDEIHFPTMEECRDEEDIDPLSFSVQYFARRGFALGEMMTTSGDGDQPMVFFDKERVSPSKLDQVWRVVEDV